MEELMQVIVNNGLGVASFLALIYFYNMYVSKITLTNEKICSSLESIEKTLTELSLRVDRIENKNDKF